MEGGLCNFGHLSHARDANARTLRASGRQRRTASVGAVSTPVDLHAIEPEDYGPLREELIGDLRELCERSGLDWPDELDDAAP